MNQTPLSSVFKIIINIYKGFVKAAYSSLELQVWQSSDRKGNIYWQAYDPIKNRSISFGSEAEMRMWIEQYYYK